jgi:hypothetical protein
MPKPRVIRIRHGADRPPRPMGCRWCGFSPYEHDDHGALPGRPHRWEHPTSRQMAARMAVRRRLGLCGTFPPPTRPLTIHPPARMGRQAAAAPGRGRSPDTRSRRQASRRGAAT